MPFAPPYRGRFAPSPTGLLHAGSLTTAVGSYLQARTQGGEWLLRIEDLDPPREMPGASAAILRTLEAFGFVWDGPVVYQSQRLDAYQQALDHLVAQQRAYPCACTRREIALAGQAGLDGVVYPGTCRAGLPAGRTGRAWRLRVPAGLARVGGGLHGPIQQDVVGGGGGYGVKRGGVARAGLADCRRRCAGAGHRDLRLQRRLAAQAVSGAGQCRRGEA